MQYTADWVPGFHVEGLPKVREALAVVVHLVVHDPPLVEALVIRGDSRGFCQVLRTKNA